MATDKADTAGMKETGHLLIMGKLVIDEILYCAFPPSPGTAQHAVRREIAGGGQVWHTTHAARAAGAKVTVTGWCGDDTDASFLRSQLAGEGITDKLIVAGDTVRALVIVGPDGDRAIISHSGIGLLTPDMLDAESLLEGAQVLHVDGYALDTVSGDAVVFLTHEAAKRGIPVTLEPPSRNRVETASPWLRELPALDVLLGRSDELAACLQILPHSPSITVAHDGPDPVTVTADGVATRVLVTAPPKGFVSTGAGDRFAGGWLTAWMQGTSPADSVKQGIEAAHC